MSKTVTIAVDAMGGDFGPRVTVSAALASLQRHSGLSIQLYGQANSLHKHIVSVPEHLRGRLHVHDAPDVVEMGESPLSALRQKRQSSMRLCLDAVAGGRAQACVSAGNTGALVAMGCHVLKTLPGIDRPAICSALPTRQGPAYLLDSGANVDCSPDQLLQFAVMGSALCSALHGVVQPRVRLLNIGAEAIKGDERVRLAQQRLAACESLNYTGFVEGDSMFDGGAEVIVCDGFAGNVALKSAEGSARLVAWLVRRELGRSWWSRCLALLAMPALRRVRAAVDPSAYNGACLLGLRGVVVKSHGGADHQAFARAIDRAVEAASSNMAARIESELQRIYPLS